MVITKRSRAAAGGVAGLIAATAFLATPAFTGEAQAQGCVKSFSKYAGTVCVPPVSPEVQRDTATIFFGCLFGAVGGTPASIGYGCLGGVVSVAIGKSWPEKS